MQAHEIHHISLDKRRGKNAFSVGYTSQPNGIVKKGTNDISRCQIRNISVKKGMKNKYRCQISEEKN